MISSQVVVAVQQEMKFEREPAAICCQCCQHMHYNDDEGYRCFLNPAVEFQVLPGSRCAHFKAKSTKP